MEESPELVGDDWEGYRQKRLELTKAGSVINDDLLGKATAKGIELYFEQRKINPNGKWVRRIPNTDLKVSALTHAVKRMEGTNETHIAAVHRSLQLGINTFEFSITDSTSVSCLANAYENSSNCSRSGLVTIARVGWVVFDTWAEVNPIAPDYTAVPNSREISTYGRDFSTPSLSTSGQISLMTNKGALTYTPDALGDMMNRKYRFYIPGQPSINIHKLSEGALFKLAGLITINKKLGAYWSGADHVLRGQVESFLNQGLSCVDIVLLDAVHLARGVAKTDEELVEYLTISFKELEVMADEGKLQYYGVESDRFWGGSETTDFIDLRLVLQAAKNAGGEKHRFRVVSQPFNLTERGALLTKMADDYTKTVFDFLKENNLASFTTRPLATYDHEGREQRYVNHARVTDTSTMTNNVSMNIQNCVMLEEACDRLVANMVLRPDPMLYHLGRSLIGASKMLNNWYLYDRYMRMWFAKIASKCLETLSDSKDSVISKWTAQYDRAFNALAESYSVMLLHAHAMRDEKIIAGIESCLDDETNLGNELPQMAVNALLATNVMQTVSVGLRTNIYVDGLIARNKAVLAPVPVSIIGRLFTEPEVSFQERVKEVKYVVTVPEEYKNMSEDDLKRLSTEKYEKTGIMGEKHVHNEGDELPSWVKPAN
eukprot:TRINITY_DN47295_c0_g1_i1.p1 TRINITY_DN47295_c0_g1~~TRINITY_DN47295_c0_g1_i1.p1  ORF type:complete len:711 (+),score=207.28 TRINITY_DN47295_c0_g1_i1:160-2133(+)